MADLDLMYEHTLVLKTRASKSFEKEMDPTKQN